MYHPKRRRLAIHACIAVMIILWVLLYITINSSDRFGQCLSDIKVAVSEMWSSRAWLKDSKAVDYDEGYTESRYYTFTVVANETNLRRE